VVPRGTTGVVADPHEIANVLGMEGVRWLLDSARGIPLDVHAMAPSCVPPARWSPRAAR
jgi:adenine deaminase